ncbi:hypothetical protein [Methylosinus sp. LW3]|uniref:hypothetical protein n=1 Tax=Methylosinus sp. LW3 TaxID=107635 RepID=UPI0012FB5310|nr:hypothetical protein [Methylosinus sp. LW3]
MRNKINKDANKAVRISSSFAFVLRTATNSSKWLDAGDAGSLRHIAPGREQREGKESLSWAAFAAILIATGADKNRPGLGEKIDPEKGSVFVIGLIAISVRLAIVGKQSHGPGAQLLLENFLIIAARIKLLKLYSASPFGAVENDVDRGVAFIASFARRARADPDRQIDVAKSPQAQLPPQMVSHAEVFLGVLGIGEALPFDVRKRGDFSVPLALREGEEQRFERAARGERLDRRIESHRENEGNYETIFAAGKSHGVHRL